MPVDELELGSEDLYLGDPRLQAQARDLITLAGAALRDGRCRAPRRLK